MDFYQKQESSVESQIDLFLEHLKRSSVLSMTEPSDFSVSSFIKRSRSGMSFSDDGTFNSAEEISECLAVRDVVDLLQLQYAIITGGKTADGYPIMTFPDTSNFTGLADVEYQKLMLYLTSVPSMQEADLGFVLVIDRRNDRWNSIKSTLSKVSGFFPGLIHVAYVLRPTSFLQKAISEVSNKFFKEEFKFKVVVCNNLDELHERIDPSQLTSDLGGSLNYQHLEWISQREELEKLSTAMKQLSCKLHYFIDTLENTCIGSNVPFEKLLAAQSTGKEYDELKEEILDAAKQLECLLDSFRKGSPIDMYHGDKLGNVAAVERLLVQLEETERTFDESWLCHSSKLKLCIQHKMFEQDFEQLTVKLDQHLKIISEMIEVGDTVDRVTTLLQEAVSFQRLTLIDLEKSEEIISSGQQLLKSKQFSNNDSIQSRCDELKRKCIILNERIDYRLDCLSKHRELQERIDQANRWCSKGIELLSSLQVEKQSQNNQNLENYIQDIQKFLSSGSYFESDGDNSIFKDNVTTETKPLVTQVRQRAADVASMCEKRLSSLKLMVKPTRPIQTVIPEPGVPLQPSHGAPVLLRHKRILKKANTLAKMDDNRWQFDKPVPDEVEEDIPTQDSPVLKANRGHIISELVDTERTYVQELGSILKGYKNEMQSAEMQPLIPNELIGKSNILFGNLDLLYNFHGEEFLKDLENCITSTELIALCFIQRKEELHKLYSCYCQNSPKSERLREVIGDKNLFFESCQMKLGHKLPLGAYLLKPIQRITKYQLLLKDLLRCSVDGNCRTKLKEALECMLVVLKCVNDGMHQVAITGYWGDLAEEGELLNQGSFSVWAESKKIRELRLKPMQRHIFLFKKAIVFCKKEVKENNKASYHFKRLLQMSQVGLTESVKGDPRKFEIWLQGRQEVYTIQAATVEEKAQWVKLIKQVLLQQLVELKETANTRQHKPNFVHGPLRQTNSWESHKPLDTVTASNRALSYDEEVAGSGTPVAYTTVIESGEDSSDLSNSDDDDPFVELTVGNRYVVLADYRAQSHSEISLQEGDLVELLKIGCSGWWFIKVLGHFYNGQCIEGWAPGAYLGPSKKRHRIQDGRSDHKNIIPQVLNLP